MKFGSFELVKFYELGIRAMTLETKMTLKYKFHEKNNNRIIIFYLF